MTTDLSTIQVDQLPDNLAVMKLENDAIMAIATARPRNHPAIKEEVLSVLQTYPKLAQESIYSKPVGKELRIDCRCGKQYTSPGWGDLEPCPSCNKVDIRKKEEVRKYARGLSVRAAEMLAEAYGYCKVRTAMEDIDDDRVRLTASFTDYAKGRVWDESTIITKVFKKRNGTFGRTPDDRFYNVIVRAAMSKLVRECILRTVHPGLKAELFDAADRIISASLTDDNAKRIVEKFAELGVSQSQIEHLVGPMLGPDGGVKWTIENRKTLLGVYAAIESNETTIREAFGDASTVVNAPPSTPEATQQSGSSGSPHKEQPVTSQSLFADDANASDPGEASEDELFIAEWLSDELVAAFASATTIKAVDSLFDEQAAQAEPDTPMHAALVKAKLLHVSRIRNGRKS